MNRRNFLHKSASMMAGCFLGANSVSKVFACEISTGIPMIKPRIALIIDDIGNSRSRARQFLDLNVPITFSVLPRLEYSCSLAMEIHRQEHEIMLHQPMEPHNSHLDPGPGALYVGDKSKTITRIIESNISDVPYAIGVNNHMGSRFTERQHEMTETLKVVKRNDLFFIDSLTTNHSQAFETAKKLHVTAARRNVFLDNTRSKSAILYQLGKLMKLSRKYGYAIGIGHPFSETAKA
ncbi:MAG: divergent polysaccharide deacetylase family protein, partial [Deltaproteobacteria bacterium]|nr:divergent polysaccharide deacetylase family protein [Deltaproteobacteria bacterium]